MNIESADVIRLIEQFLREQNLHRSLDVLQRESGVSLNTVENIDGFKADILKGRWDAVLTSVIQANLPPAKLTDLYEQIILELAEAQDLVPARALLRQTEPMDLLRTADIDRYLRLEQLLSRTSFDPRHAYGDGTGRDARRKAIASDLASQVHAAPPSRLLTLLNQSVRWQVEQGTLSVNEGPHDLFYGRVQNIQTHTVDSAPERVLATIKLPKKQHPNSVAFSPNSVYLATGSSDGFIELWNYKTGKLAADLNYQNEGAPMMMDDSVTALAFSSLGDLVCSGATNGKIKVWKVKSGSCSKRFSAAHSQGVSCVCFSDDNAQILSGGFDTILRIHGLKSGKMLKEFRGHSAGVTSAVFSHDNTRILSTSEDGTVKIWDTASAVCLHTVVPGSEEQGLSAPSAHTVLTIPGRPTEFVVCTKSTTIYIIDIDGNFKKSFSRLENGSKEEFLAASLTPGGKYVLAVSDLSALHCFDIETGHGHISARLSIPPGSVTGIAQHPSLNVAAFISNDRYVPIWTSDKID
ncbi:hypothetical protein IW140_002260 [Coemansia sp. RSA 1813]|nr:hypothetical protein EV178_001770 [Coemansia sp. RSA 1646]KAJ1770916.1 hypothetical protein LPJ74_002812 [Coemansia sp. RSA 1843]KAJ2092917.1 hypothetical protein IW138_000630 [Coemansia sp. RSA 986]KAJ2216238.1 hypothetical protein EV179_001476 [Coemansia sp. RSA 487]KAJ2570588.1 hypothetical protein IW140_002260 [Coemansia sp. RSA 1813]